MSARANKHNWPRTAGMGTSFGVRDPMKERHNIEKLEGADDVEQPALQTAESAGRARSPISHVQHSSQTGPVVNGSLVFQSSPSPTTTVEGVKDGAHAPHFDASGRFIHHCKCRREASFGFGVNLRKGRLGTWYCAACKPPECSVAGQKAPTNTAGRSGDAPTAAAS
jgi:hypothetical protein